MKHGPNPWKNMDNKHDTKGKSKSGKKKKNHSRQLQLSASNLVTLSLVDKFPGHHFAPSLAQLTVKVLNVCRALATRGSISI